MIVVDPLFSTARFTKPSTPRCFKNTQACHMMSTLEGKAGTVELVAFARRIGLKEKWIQRRGTALEHFDLTEKRRSAALAAGAYEVRRGWRRGDSVPSAEHVFKMTCPVCGRQAEVKGTGPLTNEVVKAYFRAFALECHDVVGLADPAA